MRKDALTQQDLRQHKQLSFINLVEAFVLAGIRRDHEIPLPKVPKALDYVKRSFGTPARWPKSSSRPTAQETAAAAS